MTEGFPENVGSRLGDLRDLPQELLQQIPSARTDALERAIHALIEGQFGGVASVDEVLVGLYRADGTILDRKKLSSKLYRMVNSNPPLLVAVPKRRGVYRISE